MLRGRDAAADRGCLGGRRGVGRTARSCAPVLGLCAVVLAGCSGRGDGTTGGAQPPGRRHGPVSPWKDGIGQVGNAVRGIDAMPDYDAEARYLRERVEPQLPEPLPSPKAACVSMLDQARQYYEGTEGEASTAVRTMTATRAVDLTACVEETSPAAAACVAVLMRHNEGEFPWVLDQCSRAFPSQRDGEG